MPRSDIVGLMKDLFLTFWEFSTLIFWVVCTRFNHLNSDWGLTVGHNFDDEILFSRYFLATFISSYENSLLGSISCFLNDLFVKLYAYWVLYILGINPLPKIFPSPCDLSLHLLGYFLSCSTAFGFEVPLVSVGLN